MHKHIPLIGFLSLVALHAAAAEVQAPTCEQLREQIRSQTGVSSKADIELLQKLSGRQECRFSAAEIYRAAYGDKPMPKSESRSHRKHRHDDDD